MKHNEAHALSRKLHRARTSFALPLLCGPVLWAVDALSLVSRHQQWPVRQLFLGLGVALITVLGASLVVASLVFALTWLGLSAPRANRDSLCGSLVRWLSTREPSQARARASLLCGLAFGLSVYLVTTRMSAEQIIFHMARPGYAALAVTATQLLIALGLLALSAPLFTLGCLLVDATYRLPRLGALLFGSPLRCALALAACGLTVCAEFGVQYRSALGYLPWPRIEFWIVAWSAALMLSASLLWRWATLPPTLRRALSAIAVGTVSLAALASALAGPHDLAAHDIAERKLGSARIALDILHLLADFDRDGHLSLVGGDCAGWDGDVHPGALDIPGNGRDEDCDGADAQVGTFVLQSGSYHDVPADLPRRPPIVLITVDTFAASHVGSFGYARDVTPKLDAIARRSALFRSCYAEGPSTRLSFPSLFTSHWDSQIRSELVGRHPYPLHESELLLAEMLRDAGYETSAIISEPYFTPERWRGLTSGFNTLSRSALDGQAHNASAVTDAAIRALQTAGDKPKFVWVHYFDAHPTHEQPDGSPSYGESDRDLYDAELRLVDRELGRLVEHVETLYAGQAVLVITGDHGIDFDAPRHRTEHYGYDLSSAVLHVPLIVRAPFVAAHSFDHVVSTMDIMPTLLNVLRVHSARPLHGVSLLPELLSGDRQRPGLLFHQMFLLERQWKGDDPLTMVSVRTDRFSLIHDRQHDLYELYDYRQDPLEERDLSPSPVYGDTFVSLKNILQEFTYLVHHKSRPSSAAL